MQKTALVLALVFCMSVTCHGAETEIVVSVAGDCTLGTDERYGTWNSFISEYRQQGRSYFLENVKPIFESSDLAVVNLEGPLTNSKTHADKEFVFKGPPEFAGILTEGGVDAVNLANNHTMDYGQAGYSDTVQTLSDAGVGYFGNDKDLMYRVGDVTIGLLGYKYWGVDAAAKERITRDIAGLRAQGAAIVIVSFHWGDERSNYPNGVQKTLAHAAVDAGADLVFGHHPHVIQGIENYNGKNIVYSLGNFCYGGHRNPEDKDSFIFRQSFSVEDGKAVVSGSSIIPVSISSVRTRNDYRPTPLTGEDAERVLERLRKYSEGL